jgi:AcrR family transcriptional regulator
VTIAHDTHDVEVPVPSARPQRKDAARNHALLLDAARAVFAERGLEASLDDIAREAGLGVGTAYRHFPNKQAVASALFEQAIEETIEIADHALTIADPWSGLVTYFEATATQQAHSRGLRQVLAGTHTPEQLQRLRDRLTEPIQRLFARAKDAGVLRVDAEPTDIGLIFCMLGPIFDMNSTGAFPNLWRRYLAVLLDGLRAHDAPRLPARALDSVEFAAAVEALKAASGHPTGS